MKKLSIIILALVVVAGCVPKKLDRAQYVALDEATQAAMTRTYKGFSQEQLIEAAEKALLQSDKDYRITSHRKDGFFATRRWSTYLVLTFVEGHDSWRIQANGNKITATAWSSGQGAFVPMFGMSPQTGQINTVTGNTTSGPGSDSAEYYLSPPLYDLFFERMDYILGLRSDWAPCAKIDKTKYHYTHGLENGNDPLCYHARSQDPTKGSGSGAGQKNAYGI